jgi:hypothetical protein
MNFGPENLKKIQIHLTFRKTGAKRKMQCRQRALNSLSNKSPSCQSHVSNCSLSFRWWKTFSGYVPSVLSRNFYTTKFCRYFYIFNLEHRVPTGCISGKIWRGKEKRGKLWKEKGKRGKVEFKLKKGEIKANMCKCERQKKCEGWANIGIYLLWKNMVFWGEGMVFGPIFS